MHYFKRNIGDYHKKAGRLSMLEHGAYTLLIDSCYDRERFPTEVEAIDWCWARTDEEIAAVRFVLSKFFYFLDGCYVQDRIREEIEAYHSRALKNKEIAEKREEDRRAVREQKSTNRARIVNESPPNHKPLTINQEPIEKIKTKPSLSSSDLVALGVDEKVAQEFVAMRKRKRAPMTEIVLEGIKRESANASMSLNDALRTSIERGWQSFKAEWVVDKSTGAKKHGDFSSQDYRAGITDDGRF